MKPLPDFRIRKFLIQLLIRSLDLIVGVKMTCLRFFNQHADGVRNIVSIIPVGGKFHGNQPDTENRSDFQCLIVQSAVMPGNLGQRIGIGGCPDKVGVHPIPGKIVFICKLCDHIPDSGCGMEDHIEILGSLSETIVQHNAAAAHNNDLCRSLSKGFPVCFANFLIISMTLDLVIIFSDDIVQISFIDVVIQKFRDASFRRYCHKGRITYIVGLG